MLFTPKNEFHWSVDNFGATYTDAGFGASATSGGSANTKGAAVSLIAGASVTEDVYGIAICFSGGNASAAVRNYLADILVDEAGGSSWTVRIPNLLVNSAALGAGGYWYYFPLFIKAGSSIGFQQQCGVASTALRCGVKLFGKPSRPDLIKAGSKVEAIGVNTGTSQGTAITPGTSAMGSYTAALGTAANDNWWWQGGFATNDTTQTTLLYLLDIAAGDATNKKLCCENLRITNTTAEFMGKGHTGTRDNIRHIKAGESVYARAAGIAAPDNTCTVAAYGLSG
jgi:hypothetical protein